MNKLVILDLYGNLEQGFNVSLELGCDRNYRPEIKVKAQLPPARELIQKYQNWYQSYYQIGGASLRIKARNIQIKNVNIESKIKECKARSEELLICFNDWLKAKSFAAIEAECLQQLKPEDKIRIAIGTCDLTVKKLPWNYWNLWKQYNYCEIGLNSSSRALKTRKKIRDDRIRMLAIFGSDRGIDLEKDRKKIQEFCSDSRSEITFLNQPSKQKFNRIISEEKGWDIIFFSGHSNSSDRALSGKFKINDREYLTIEELKSSWQEAAAKRLKIAFFNSCDGLGIAAELENLNIPQIIVMREAVADLVAQNFIEHFLNKFTTGISLYESVNYARQKLQILENNYPCASWLPVIVQNPLETPPNWQNLGGIPQSPYQGLSAFTSENARFFFGREKFTKKLVNAVEKVPLIAIVGASGSGKSSVVNAGLIPKLKQQQIIKWQIISIRPKNNPFAALASVLFAFWQDKKIIFNLKEELELEKYLRKEKQNLANITLKSSARFLLVIDQFEELFTLCSQAESQSFLDILIAAIESSENFTVVITLRADFYGKALAYPPFGKLLEKYLHLPLIAMNEAQLKQAIELPAQLTNVELEAGLSARIINSVKNKPGSLPLLEFTLTQLWSKQEELLLTHEAYNQIGGVEQALANYAETIYQKINSRERQKLRRIFMQLVQPGIETEATRRLATKEQVKDWDLVTFLAHARLLVTGWNEKTGLETVEIVHEALIQNWLRLNLWIELDRDFRNWQESLRSAMLTWESSLKDEGGLLRGKPLADAEDWYCKRSIELSDRERDFIELSLKLRDRQLKIEKRRRKLTISGLSSGLILSLSLAGFAGWQWQKARISEIRSFRSSAETFLTLNEDFDGLMLSIKAANSMQTIFGLDDRTRREVIDTLLETFYFTREYNRLENHGDRVNDIIFSPDGKIIATASRDKTVKLWSDRGKEITTLRGHQEEVFAVSFSPDGKTIATASCDKTVKLWNLRGRELLTLSGHTGGVNNVLFSPDGKIIATAGWDKTIKLWTKEGEKIASFYAHNDTINKIRFSSDGDKILSSSSDKTVKLWSKKGELIDVIEGHNGVVYGVAFSPNNKQIATASWDNTAKLWNLDNRQLRILHGHKKRVFSVVYSPDGQIIASGSWDNTARLWSKDGQYLRSLEGHLDTVNEVDFCPDGETIATASSDKTVKLWSKDGNLLTTLSGHQDMVWGVNFSPDGEAIATASADETVKIWNRNGNLLKTLRGHTNGVNSVVFSPDGQIIASGSWDNTVKLWTRDGQYLKTLKEYRDRINSIAFSPDGKIIAAASGDKTVKLWSLKGTLLRSLRGHEEVWSVNFSPDGKTLITGSSDRTIILWRSYLDGLDPLLTRACHKVSDYLENNPKVSPDDRGLCREK
ncbi:MAG: CHAT domain-containing protein [Prochloraceae cyanobacterium]